MLHIHIPKQEIFNEKTSEFITLPGFDLRLEHSLVSLTKWEGLHHKPFLTRRDLTIDETLSYIRCMTVTQNVDPSVYKRLDQSHIDKVTAYIEDPMSATTFSSNKKGKSSNEVITSEIIYYWMVSFNIPFECQRWHLNRLLTLIKVCNIKNGSPKKMTKAEILRQQRALNNSRRARLNTTG